MLQKKYNILKINRSVNKLIQYKIYGVVNSKLLASYFLQKYNVFMDSDYISFKDAINKKKLEVSTPLKSQRAELFKELYSYYEKSYKKNTWTEYIAWLKKNKYKHSIARVSEYNKIKRPKITVRSFCSYWLSFIPTSDLYYIISIAKDMEQRNQNFNKWLFYSIKNKL